jgi:hypothetical protein
MTGTYVLQFGHANTTSVVNNFPDGSSQTFNTDVEVNFTFDSNEGETRTQTQRVTTTSTAPLSLSATFTFQNSGTYTVKATGTIILRVSLITATPVYDPATKALISMNITTTRDYMSSYFQRSVQRLTSVTAP